MRTVRLTEREHRAALACLRDLLSEDSWLGSKFRDSNPSAHYFFSLCQVKAKLEGAVKAPKEEQ